MEGALHFGGTTPQHVAANSAWISEDTFMAQLYLYETPFSQTITCRFEGARLFYDLKVSVGLGLLERPQLVGILDDIAMMVSR
jgi:hypothetical protein